jgi:hypothetical protein
LILTETAGTNCFHGLLHDPDILTSTGWRVTPTDETCSLLLDRDHTPTLVIVAGRQIVTSERLEVLALGLTEELSDGRSLQETLSAVASREAIPVLPWGFGKWWGRRGRLVQSLLTVRLRGSFCLGDNGGRPRGMPRPGLLQRAESNGFIVLAGSDPLRLPSHVTRAGSFGSILPDWAPTARPMVAIRARIETAPQSPLYFGSPSSLPRSLYSQLALRFRLAPSR